LLLAKPVDHIGLMENLVREELGDSVEEFPNILAIYGSQKKKQREEAKARLESLPPRSPRLIIATGQFFGEGLDHPPLDTLILASPIAWRGTLSQYAGRLNRPSEGKEDVRVYDYAEKGDPRLNRKWAKRLKGYRQLRYKILE
jgi:superfamily II DNA or RNA helicase